jgi:hypothetical protein
MSGLKLLQHSGSTSNYLDPVVVREQGAYLRSVLLGHFRYYGVPMNGPALCSFRHAVGYLWRTVLRRRSQGNHLPWRRLWRYIAKWSLLRLLYDWHKI